MIRFLTFLCIVAAVSSIDYCFPSICGNYTPDICSGDPFNGEVKEIKFTDSLKGVLVKSHNAKRNLIAGGKVARHSPACRMATMVWDDKLANLVTFGVRECKHFKNSCYNTTDFKYSGKISLGIVMKKPKYRHHIREIVNYWYSGVSYSKQSYIDSFPDGILHPFFYTFATMVADRNIRIGCAGRTFAPYNTFMLDCMYATTYRIGFPIYDSCKKAATACKTGTNPKYPNLCSTAEKYNVNKWDK